MRLCQRLLINEIQYRKHEFAIAWIIPISTRWFSSQPYEPLERPTHEDMVNGPHLRGNFKVLSSINNIYKNSSSFFPPKISHIMQ